MFNCRDHMNRSTVRTALSISLALAMVGLGGGCASCHPPAVTTAPTPALQKKWGIEVTSLRLSGNGHLIDFRYRVLDPVKAATVGDPRNTPHLVDQATGIRMNVPNTPKIGPLRQSSTQLEAGKIYFILFANAGQRVKSGSKVTVEIGGFRGENLMVE